MSLINNIKYQYNLRILQDYISANKYSDFFSSLEEFKNNDYIYYKLLTDLCVDVVLKCNEDLFKSKIIWLSSFISEDTNYINNFLNFYNKEIGNKIENVSNYEEKLTSLLKKVTPISKLNFADFVDRSYMYQYLILHENKLPIKFISNHLPFFSSENNLNFTKSTLTKSFIYILDHPYNVYQTIKDSNHNDQEIARNYFLNLDNHSFFKNINNIDVEFNKQGWHTHTMSWTNTNVINSLNGKVIIKNDLINDTYEVLSSIILHLIQSGANLNMDYKIIDKYIEKYPFEKRSLNIDISQKEKKFLNKYVDNVTSSYNLELL